VSEFEQFEALSFDCYGTMIDWEAGILAELRPWATGHGIGAADDELIGAFAEIETLVQQEQPATLYPDVLAETLRRMGARLGVITGEAEAVAFGGSVDRWPPFEDSADALARLKQRFKLVILSNVDRASFASSNQQLGVEFDLIVTAEDVGAYKPSERCFAALFERLDSIGVGRDRLLHVAQSLYHDHEPAQALGLPCLWIDRRLGQSGSGATPEPRRAGVTPPWRYRSLAEFADEVIGAL
jgi:2-haloacid dehalogenase